MREGGGLMCSSEGIWWFDAEWHKTHFLLVVKLRILTPKLSISGKSSGILLCASSLIMRSVLCLDSQIKTFIVAALACMLTCQPRPCIGAGTAVQPSGCKLYLGLVQKASAKSQ